MFMKLKFICAVLIFALTLCLCGCIESNVDKLNSSYSLGNTKYPQKEPPTSPPSFLWEFSNDNEYSYTGECSLITNWKASTGDKSADESFGSDSVVRLVLMSRYDETAVVLFGLEEKTREQTESPKSITCISLAQVGYMESNGSFHSHDPSEQLTTMLFLPMNNDLANIGDSIELPVTFPFEFAPEHIEQELQFLEGTATLTLSDYVEIEGELCAEIDGVISVSQQGSYDDSGSHYNCNVHGNSKIYFAINSNRWMAGELVLTEVVTGEVVNPDASPTESEGSTLNKMDFETTIDTWIKISFSGSDNENEQTLPHPEFTLSDANELLDISLILPDSFEHVDAKSQGISASNMAVNGSEFATVQAFLSEEPLQLITAYLIVNKSNLEKLLSDAFASDDELIKSQLIEGIQAGAAEEGEYEIDVNADDILISHPNIGNIAAYAHITYEEDDLIFSYDSLSFRRNDKYILLFSYCPSTESFVSLEPLAKSLDDRLLNLEQ